MTKKNIYHRYSDLLAFERLMILVATLARYPGVGSRDNPLLKNQDPLEQLLAMMQEVATEVEVDLPNYSIHTLRKDLATLRNYGILQQHMYRWGYYLGTGALDKVELRFALNALRSQVEYQEDPLVRQTYSKLKRRLRQFDLEEEFSYPLRTQLSKVIVYTSPEEMMQEGKYRGTLFEKLGEIEEAILQGQAIEIKRVRNPHQKGKGLFLQSIWPLQLIYHDIAWYLLHENYENGHLAISRLDRFNGYYQALDVPARGIQAQLESLQTAKELLRNGWGLYLGKFEEQLEEKEGKGNLVEVKVRFFGDAIAFVLEGEKRHHSQRIKKGAIDAEGWLTCIDYEIKLPRRSLKEFSYWVNRFFGKAVFKQPSFMAEEQVSQAKALLERG